MLVYLSIDIDVLDPVYGDSLDVVTDFQATCIVDRAMHFEDITYDPADYTIDGKINSELSRAFPLLDEQTELLFNIHYVTLANLWGFKVLLKKLELKEQELTEEMKSLQTYIISNVCGTARVTNEALEAADRSLAQ